MTTWRHDRVPAPQARPLSRELSNLPMDPVTGRCISPLAAAALCIKPRPLFTAAQTRKVDVLKGSSPDFAAMRHLAMRLWGLLRGGRSAKLKRWLDDAQDSGIYAMQRFARKVLQDTAAVTNALTQPWSSGQVEGQINRLKALKRSMFGRAGAELLRARMLPITALV
jgi:hypothetical protein